MNQATRRSTPVRAVIAATWALLSWLCSPCRAGDALLALPTASAVAPLLELQYGVEMPSPGRRAHDAESMALTYFGESTDVTARTSLERGARATSRSSRAAGAGVDADVVGAARVGSTSVKVRGYLSEDSTRNGATTTAVLARLRVPEAGWRAAECGVGAEAEKRVGRLSLYGDVRLDLAPATTSPFVPRPGASLGAAFDLANSVSVSTDLGWRQPRIGAERLGMGASASYRLTPTLRLLFDVTRDIVGRRSDVGIELMLAYRFTMPTTGGATRP